MLVLFDIDGTLCDTFKVDGDCFIESLRQCFGFDNVNSNWDSYPHATDSGILQSVFQSELKRNPTADETNQMIACFHDLLRDAFQSDPQLCQPIRGGSAFISRLRSNRVPFAIATGGWRQTALLKLATAGYSDLDVPIATADIAISRTDICQQAVEAACKLHSKSIDPVIYIGDGLWDQRAASKLGYQFVARTKDKTKFADCPVVIEDFCAPDLMDRLITHVTKT